MPRLPKAIVALAALVLVAQARAAGGEPGKTSIGALKRAYLACNREAPGARQDSGAIMQCSVVYEALLQRGFGGDFARLLAWSKAHPSKRVAAGRAP